MAQYATITQMNGLYKEAYAEGIVPLIPDVAYLVKNIQFGEAERVGRYYHQPVVLTREAGISYAAPGAGAYALAPSVAMTMQDAQIQGSQTTLRSSIPYDTVARSLGNAKAFRKATLPIIENNLESHTKRLELALLYGQSATGLAVTASSDNNQSTTQTNMNITLATWAVGIWSGEENSKIVVYTAAGALVSDGTANSVFTIAQIIPDNSPYPQLQVNGTTTGISALDTASSTPGMIVYWYGTTGLTTADGGAGISSTWSGNSVEMVGVDNILLNTGSLFNINAGTYTLWKGNTYSASSGQLTMGKIFSGINKAVGKGGLKEKVVCLVSVYTWPNLMTDLASLRMYDDSYKDGEAVNGFETVRYYGANGEIEVVPHLCVKGGEAFVLPLKRWARVGATEITFNTPGRGDEIFLQLPNVNAFEIRSYADQATFCRTPAKNVKITSIVNV